MPGLTNFRDVDHLSPTDFEFFVRDVFAAAGWTELEVTKPGEEFAHGDGGVDIVGAKHGRRFVIEVKQRSLDSRVDTAALNQLVAGARLRRVSNMILVTNSYFTQEVQVRALRLGVELIDRDCLQDMWIERHSEIGRRIVPRKYQQKVIDEIVKAYRAGKKRFLLEMATGLGKTYTAAHLVRALMAEAGGGDLRVLFLAHQVEILLQSVTSFKNVLGIGHRSYSACFNGADPEPTDLVFASFATMFTKLDRLADQMFDVILVDEAHHTPAETFAAVVKHFEPRLLVGLTATPYRNDGKDVREFFGESDGHVGRFDLQWALKRRYLAFPKYTVLLNDLDQGRIDQLGTGLSVNDLDKRLFLHKKDREVVGIIEETVKEKQIENPKGIVFCRNIRHMEHLIHFFPAGSATWVHSKMNGADRRSNIKGFREGGLRYILVCDLFNEGIDIPETNLLVFLRYTGSHSIWLQQLGRGLRRTKNKEFVHVLDFVGSLDRIYDVRNLARAVADMPADRELGEAGPDDALREPTAVHHDNGMEVTYNRSAAQVLQLIESLDYRLKSRAEALQALRDYHSRHGGAPSVDQLESLLGDISYDQIATHFDSYYGYLKASLGEQTDVSGLRAECISFISEYAAANGILPSTRAVSIASQHAGLPAYTDAEVERLAGDVLHRHESTSDSRSDPNKGTCDVRGDTPKLWESTDEDEFVRHYATIVHDLNDLCKLSAEELDRIDRVYYSRFRFLELLGKARETTTAEHG